MKEDAGNPLRLTSVNHVSLLCRSLEESMNFYQKVLGFSQVRRPGTLKSEGVWLFGYGIGIHLLRSTEPEKLPKKTAISPKDNHISFQCESMGAVEKKLDEMEIEYFRKTVEEGGIKVDQVFFHDPDGFVIEICNCDNFPIFPLVGGMAEYCSRFKLHQMVQPQPQTHIHP